MGFDRHDFPPGRVFTSAVSSCLRARDSSAALVNFRLDSYYMCKNLAVKTAIPPRILHFTARVSCSDLKRFVSEQTDLQDLCLKPSSDAPIDLVSRTVKTMKLKVDVAVLSPEMPQLKKVNLVLPSVTEESVPLLHHMLECFKNASQLSIRIESAFPKEPKREPQSALSRARRKKHLEKRQFNLLVAPGKDLSTFPHLRSLKLWMHFHEDGVSDLIGFLPNAPVLESIGASSCCS